MPQVKHQNNHLMAENHLWQPALQKAKTSEYSSQAVRYKTGLKAQFIKEWLALHEKFIPWNKIHYIF